MARLGSLSYRTSTFLSHTFLDTTFDTKYRSFHKDTIIDISFGPIELEKNVRQSRKFFVHLSTEVSLFGLYSLTSTLSFVYFVQAADVQAELQQYLNSKNINSLFIAIVESLLIEKPSNPIAFIIEYLHKQYPEQAKVAIEGIAGPRITRLVDIFLIIVRNDMKPPRHCSCTC